MNSPFLNVREAAQFARCAPKQLYRAVKAGKLKSMPANNRGDLLFLAEWLTSWRLSMATDVPVRTTGETVGAISPESWVGKGNDGGNKFTSE